MLHSPTLRLLQCVWPPLLKSCITCAEAVSHALCSPLQAFDRVSGSTVALKLYHMHKLNTISSHQVAREVSCCPSSQ
jgi:hypothetical protein